MKFSAWSYSWNQPCPQFWVHGSFQYIIFHWWVQHSCCQIVCCSALGCWGAVMERGLLCPWSLFLLTLPRCWHLGSWKILRVAPKSHKVWHRVYHEIQAAPTWISEDLGSAILDLTRSKMVAPGWKKETAGNLLMLEGLGTTGRIQEGKLKKCDTCSRSS